jgi:hypothetical protein
VIEKAWTPSASEADRQLAIIAGDVFVVSRRVEGIARFETLAMVVPGIEDLRIVRRTE